jgi:hypothetical protein
MPASKRRKKAADKTRRDLRTQHQVAAATPSSTSAAPWFPTPDESGDLLHGATLMDPITATVLQLAEEWNGLDEAAPDCRGPVLIHSGGAFECLTLCGSDETAVLATYQDVHQAAASCDDALRWDFTIQRPCLWCSDRGLVTKPAPSLR